MEYKYVNTDTEYHHNQFAKPYRSTEVFVEWLNGKGVLKEGNILDVGAGGGGNIKYMSQKFPNACFTGVELDTELVGFFKANNTSDNARMIQGDVYKLTQSELAKETIDGIVSFQFLSWIPEIMSALEQMIALNPDWIAASSLFFDGKVQYKVVIEDYNYPTEDMPFAKYYQHVYAMDVVKEFFYENGYTHFDYMKFDIDIDLPNVNPQKRGTYTVKTEEGIRLQISANMLMPWYFIFAAKN